MELSKLDLQFCKESKIDKEKAWDKFTSSEIVMGTPKDIPFIDDKNEIIKMLKNLYSVPSMDFDWKPQYEFVSGDETLGVTVGVYKRVYMKDNKEVIDTGKYISVWKKIDNDWKIILDMGN